MSLIEETQNTKHTQVEQPSDVIHIKLVSKTLINPDCDCMYAIYLNFIDAKGLFCHLVVCLLW